MDPSLVFSLWSQNGNKPPTIICWQSCTSADTHLPISQNQPTYFVYHLLQKGREMLIPFTKIYLFPGHSSEELEDSLDEILWSQKQSSLDTCTSSAVLIMQRKALALRGGEWDPGLCKLLGFQILANYKNRGRILLSDDADTVYTPNSESLSQPVQLFFKASASLKKKKKGKKSKRTSQNLPTYTGIDKMKGTAAYASFAEVFLLNDLWGKITATLSDATDTVEMMRFFASRHPSSKLRKV